MVGLVGTIGLLRRRERRRERARGRVRVRVAAVVLALLAVQVGSLVAPAYACGCGALVPGGGQRVTVGREVSVVRWDGRQEQIVMSLTVRGDADRAAWIMPVPRRATVELGDAELFDQLAAATAPERRSRTHFWPQDGDWPLTSGDGRRGPPPRVGARAGAEVGVVGRERLGPFDVARLTATDPAALNAWLSSNDFTFPAPLETALRPYVSRGWEYVAVKLAPETSGTVLSGDLEPLHLTFAADAPVYPMRLSRLATTPQSLGLYVLAAHRMESASRIGGERPRVTFAGRIGTATKGPLGELAAGTPFLTAVAQEFPQPSAISGDHELRRAATDTAFRQVIYEDSLLKAAGVPVWLLTVVGGLATVTAASAALGIRRGRTRRTTQPGPRHASGRQAGAAPGPTVTPGVVPGDGVVPPRPSVPPAAPTVRPASPPPPEPAAPPTASAPAPSSQPSTAPAPPPPAPPVPPRPLRPPGSASVPPRPEGAPSVAPKPFTLPGVRPEPNG